MLETPRVAKGERNKALQTAEKLSDAGGDGRQSIQYRPMWSQNETPVFPFSLGINVFSAQEYKGHSERRLTSVASQNSRL